MFSSFFTNEEDHSLFQLDPLKSGLNYLKALKEKRQYKKREVPEDFQK